MVAATIPLQNVYDPKFRVTAKRSNTFRIVYWEGTSLAVAIIKLIAARIEYNGDYVMLEWA